MEPFQPQAGAAAGNEGGCDNSLAPTRFVWPYGGTKVFLTGSFTGWSTHLQMMPLEGCPTVFQTIQRLAPGVYMYKFNVDGEWLHDEHQPSVTSKYGMVNTIRLPAQPVLVSASTSSGTSVSGFNMGVDNKSFRTAGISYDISKTDIEISRHRVSDFLSTHSAYDLLPDSGKVIALDVKLPVKQAFHVLYEQGIPVAPLLDFNRGQFVGMLTALDFILILRELGSHSTSLTEEELESHAISTWKEGKHKLGSAGHNRPLPRNLICAGPYDPLKDVVLKILQNEVASVPIIYPNSEDGSFPQLLHLASLSGVLKCICRQFQHSSSSLPILRYPISAFPLGTWVPKIGESNGRSLAMLNPTASLSTALSMLVETGVSSLPIVDDKDSLLDVYSRSDITALAKDKAYAKIHLEETTIHQALQYGQDTASPFVLSTRQKMCLRSDSLFEVMDRLSKPGVRRLVVVEAGSNRVEGIISLSDVFRLLLAG